MCKGTGAGLEFPDPLPLGASCCREGREGPCSALPDISDVPPGFQTAPGMRPYGMPDETDPTRTGFILNGEFQILKNEAKYTAQEHV